jgi:hypothetical protein
VADSDDTYSAASWWADGSNANATSEYGADAGPDVPGYDAGTAVPGTEHDPPNAKTDLPTSAVPDNGVSATDYQPDPVSTTASGGSLESTQQALSSMGGNAQSALREAVSATATRNIFGQVTGMSIGTGEAGSGPPPGQEQPPKPQPTANLWAPVSLGGYLAANLMYTDASLIAALQSAGAAAGDQAALVAQTVALSEGTIRAGGSTPVGARAAPASALAAGSENNSAPQFSCGPWFFPAVAAWAAANPVPPEQNPQGGAAGPDTADMTPEGG